MKMMDKLKKKWGIKSNWDFFLINVVFTLAGSTIIFERKPIFELLGIGPETPFWIKVCVYIPLIVPIYQINLLIFGFLLGQFPFFWDKEKKLMQFLIKRIRPKKEEFPPPLTVTEKSAKTHKALDK